MLRVLVKPYLQKLKITLKSNWFYIFLTIFLLFYIIFLTVIVTYSSQYKNPQIIEGTITKIEKDDDKIEFILKGKEKIRCLYYEDIPNIYDYLGKKVKVWGSELSVYNNTIPNTFNYKKYLYQKKIYLNYEVNKIEVIKDANIFYKIKTAVNKRIIYLSNDNELLNTYLNLFILGDKSQLNDDLKNIYKVNGISHLFAISGMHISLFILVLNKLLSKFHHKKIFISAFLLFYSFLVNFSASVLRVTTFYILENTFKHYNINLNNIKILFLTLAILLFANPFLIYDVSFQYSFLIAFSLQLFQNKITGNYFLKIYKISLIAFLASLPMTINLNYEINILSIILNIIFVPLVSLIIFPLCMSYFLIPYLKGPLILSLKILEGLNKLFYLYRLSIIVPKMALILIIIYYLIGFLIFLKKHYKLEIVLPIIILINILVYKLDSNYYVYYLDVSQGDSTLLISPFKREVVMIDTGGTYNNYHVSNNVIALLKSLGIGKINLLIISHGDLDHAKEALNYLANYQIDNIILNNNSYNELENEIIKKGNVVNNYVSNYFDYQNINDYLSNNENDSSIITYLTIYNYQFLFMGDAPKEVEEKLIKDYNLTADFLKIGHHGSDTSTSPNFIKKVNPLISIISVGRNNRYGHPKERVLDILKDYQVYRTDENGTIQIKIKPNSYVIKTYDP